MRCDCCNRNLSDYEATLRHAVTNDFVNTCMKCLDGLEIPVRGRPDLNPFEDADALYEEDFQNVEDMDDDETI